MRQRAIPFLAPSTKGRHNTDEGYDTKARGLAVLNSPFLNKGVAFTSEERKQLGLTGLLPPDVSTVRMQVQRAYSHYERLPDALSKNGYLTSLHDSNEVLFYRLLAEHLREMISIVSDVTSWIPVEQCHHETRRPRGLYLSINDPGAIEEALENLGAGPYDIDLILATDAEQIPGMGDWGVSGIELSIGKLAILTAAGGIDPARVFPVMLDCGTNRDTLLNDPTYIGNRHARIRGERYDAFIDAYFKAVTKLFPKALLQWEGFAPGNGRRILDKYRGQTRTFNDDTQGTGAIALAAAISAVRVCGVPLRRQRVVILGAGTAGIGIADQIRDAMVRDGLTKEAAVSRFWCVDRQGLLVNKMTGQLRDFQVSYARSEDESWPVDGSGNGPGLAEVVHRVHPTMLIGASTAPGAFTEAIVKDMAAHTERPIILALSTPASRSEATPADLIAWTNGRGLIATGSASGPVTHRGVTHAIGHVNNVLLYPGLCLGAIVSRARVISDGMLTAASSAVSSLVAVRQPGASLLPLTDDLRAVAVTVAVAVAEAAMAEGLAAVELDDIVQQVQASMWQPEYRRIQAC
jgi:malate dehydrogenase (oxaloacetate-decarboxylating)